MASWDPYHSDIEVPTTNRGIPAYDFLVFAVLITWNKVDSEIMIAYSELQDRVRRKLINAGESPSISYGFDETTFYECFKEYPGIKRVKEGMYSIRVDRFSEYTRAVGDFVEDRTRYKEGVLKRAFNI